jgi:DNA polymerase III alpha subunit
VYVAKGSRHDRGEKDCNGPNGRRRGEWSRGRGSNHLVLLCENLKGYHNLIKLVSAGFSKAFTTSRESTTTSLPSTARADRAVGMPERAVTEASVEESTIRRARTPTGCATFSASRISF